MLIHVSADLSTRARKQKQVMSISLLMDNENMVHKYNKYAKL